MKYWLALGLVSILPFVLAAQSKYIYHTNLSNIEHDKVKVELEEERIALSGPVARIASMICSRPWPALTHQSPDVPSKTSRPSAVW